MRFAKPRVSVIIPTYNRSDFIFQAVDSVLKQTFKDIEIIVVDDGSTDNTRDILNSFDDSRLICHFQTNSGRSHARNVALKLARGDYITFLDSDDVYLPHKIAKSVDFLDKNPEFGMIYTSASFIDDKGESIHFTYKATQQGSIYPHIAFFYPVTILLPTVMMRSTVLASVGNFDEELDRFEDTDLWRRASKKCSIGAIDEVTCLIRTHASNHLINQDPNQLVLAIEKYTSKILSEDFDVDESVIQAGVHRLMRHYGSLMKNIPEMNQQGQSLLEQSSRNFMPRVSIIIPVYNGSDFLRDAIESAIQQDYKNCEIIVINDGSDDNGATESIALSYGTTIRLINQPNGGVAAALNRGLAEMSGDYFTWLSHDDLFLPNKISSQITLLGMQPEPERCIAYSDYEVFGENLDTQTIQLPTVSPEDFRYFITTQNILHGCTLLIPRKAFERSGSFNTELRTTQDYDLWFRMARRENFIYERGVFVRARAHANQGTVRMSEIALRECNDLLGKFSEELTIEEIERGTSRSALEAFRYLADNLRGRGFSAAAERAVSRGDGYAQEVTNELRSNASRRAKAALDDLLASRRSSTQPSLVVNQTIPNDDLATENEELRARNTEMIAQNEALNRMLSDVLTSTSWRLTSPLRRIRTWKKRTI